MKIVGIVQVRMGSSRLPGKTMKDIKGKPMIWHLIERLKKSETLDSIVIATSDKENDDLIADFAQKNGKGCLQTIQIRYIVKFLLSIM